MDQDKKKIAEALSSAHLDTMFDKYIVIGFNSKEGLDAITNCSGEQLGLLLSLFHQHLLEANAEPDASSNLLNWLKMKKSQKLAVKNSLKTLQNINTDAENAAFLMLYSAFPEIAAELFEPAPENKDQMKFNFMVDSSEN